MHDLLDEGPFSPASPAGIHAALGALILSRHGINSQAGHAREPLDARSAGTWCTLWLSGGLPPGLMLLLLLVAV
jgi:hypothetical protein